MKLYKEWCSRTNVRCGRLVEVSAVERISYMYHSPGYCGVYSFDAETADVIKASGHSKGWSNYKVYSDRLYIDIDSDNPLKSADMLRAYSQVLYEKGIGHDVYFSGCKGYHIVVCHQLVGSMDLPYSHQKYIQGLGFEVDTSIYRHSGLIALPGRIHHKTGKKKVFLYRVEGNDIELEIVARPVVDVQFNLSAGTSDLGRALLNLQGLHFSPPKVGDRHMAIFGLARDLFSTGLSASTVEELILALNQQWPSPKTEEEVLAAIRGGIKWQPLMTK